MGTLGLSVGIVGLPNVGKSTLFNALTRGSAAAANYPFTTIDPNVGLATVPDPRLDAIGDALGIERRIPARVEFVDIAGLVKGASKGEGLGNQFLGHIRNVDALLVVVRCFEDDEVPHVGPRLAPLEDLEVVMLELTLADLAAIESRLEEARSGLKGRRDKPQELDHLQRLAGHLAQGRPARTMGLSEEERPAVEALNLLTSKPVLYLANVAEGGLAEAEGYATEVERIAAAAGSPSVRVCASLEEALGLWPPEDAATYLEELGLKASGLETVIQESYRLLDLITFFTATGGTEVQARTLRRGMTAAQAAGRIHTDMQKGFIRAEVIGVDDLVAAGSMSEARERGRMRLEGRDYVVEDGDLIHIRFSPPQA